MDDPIPGPVRDLIQRQIDSITQLEALLLLRANPGETWDTPRIAQRLYASERDVAEVLERLVAGGLVSGGPDGFRYEPLPALRPVVDDLAAAYARQLIPVTNLIHSKARRIQQFADAFKFRKDR